MSKQYDNSLNVPYGKQQNIPFKDAKKKTPDRMQNAWSLIGIAFAAGWVAWFAGIFFVWALSAIGMSIKIGAAGFLGGGIMLLVLLAGLWKILRDTRLITTVERITGHDLNQDGWVGPQQSTEVTLHNNRGGWRKWTLPFPQDIILEWGRAYLNGESTAYAAWETRFAVRPDGKDGEANYRLFRKCLVKGEIGRENGTHSIDLNKRGVELFQLWVEEGVDELTPLLTTGTPKRLTG